MRLFVVLLGAAVLLPMSFDAMAADGKRNARARQAERAKPVAESRRTTRVASSQSGICLQDSGRQRSSLNMGNKCDVDEFWRRVQEGTGAGE